MEKIGPCLYCGCGCFLKYIIKEGKIIRVAPWGEDIKSKGKPCIKGLSLGEVLYKNRIQKPLIKKGDKFVEVEWKEVYEYMYNKIKGLKPEEIAFYISGQITNEDQYIAQKFARLILETDNIDTCARVCHATTVYAFSHSLGIGVMPDKMEDVERADLILIFGSDPKSDYPVLFNRILESKAKIIVVDDRLNYTGEYADVWLKIKPGRYIPIINSIANYLLKFKEIPKYKNWEEIKKIWEKWNLKRGAKVSGVKQEDLKKVCELVSQSKKTIFIHGMGLTQHVYGTKNVFALVNLYLLKGGCLVPMRGKINIQGANDMGCQPKTWGKVATEFFYDDSIKFYYIIDSDPAQSLPNLKKVWARLKEAFVVYQASYPSKTMEFADVVLPGALPIEYGGTFTNGERFVRAFDPVVKIGGKPHWKIILEWGEFFEDKKEIIEKEFKYEKVWDITKEIIAKIPAYNNLNIKKLKEGQYADKIIKKKEFNPVDFTGEEEKISKEFPYILTTKRSPYHFLTGKETRLSSILMKIEGEPVFYMNPDDMKKEGIEEGEIVKIVSKVGEIQVKIKKNEKVERGMIIGNFHFEKALVNQLIPLELDPLSWEPNYKTVAVKIKKLF